MAEVQKTLQRFYRHKRDDERDDEETMAGTAPSFESKVIELRKVMRENSYLCANRSQLLSSVKVPRMGKEMLHTGTMIFSIDSFSYLRVLVVFVVYESMFLTVLNDPIPCFFLFSLWKGSVHSSIS